MQKDQKFRVVLCEDQRLFRHLLGHYLLHYPDFLLVGEAADGKEALELCLRVEPDIVLLDLQLPGMHGFDILRRLKKKLPACRVVIVTTNADPLTFEEAMRLDANGFVEKDAPIETIAQALSEVAAGGTYFSPRFRPLLQKAPRERGLHDKELSAREKELLKLLVDGVNRQDAAIQLGITLATVEKHLSRVRAKTGIGDTAALIEYARSLELA